MDKNPRLVPTLLRGERTACAAPASLARLPYPARPRSVGGGPLPRRGVGKRRLIHVMMLKTQKIDGYFQEEEKYLSIATNSSPRGKMYAVRSKIEVRGWGDIALRVRVIN